MSSAPAPAGVGLLLFAACFFPSFSAAITCFSFFLEGMVSEFPVFFAAAGSAAFWEDAGVALFSAGFAGFSFFFASKALRSTGGAEDKSSGTRSNAGESPSADLRTDEFD
jgi:hypothetical protein